MLVGISTVDTKEDVDKLTKKLVNLRIFGTPLPPDETSTTVWQERPWSKSLLQDPALKVLSVSQFTLYGTIKKGTKPDFHKAAKGETAKELYDQLLANLRKELGADDRVLDGEFGAMMDVALINDGPVTIIWDTRESTI